ncbi:unnamed protein product [Diatraea saccharalis]|uniref:Uncharacterized protein n=1 Tax=Diatraea saccharalis TaxID=40085 RepID=A0A9P0C5H3_9NEOP|nr:unnamed protein product [Diatraea saccharalis]
MSKRTVVNSSYKGLVENIAIPVELHEAGDKKFASFGSVLPIHCSTPEQVFINRTKRLLIISSDGVLAQWRCAPTFESANQYIAGTPIVNKDGALVSVVTAKRGNHYAVSTFEGEGGYFETSEAWKVIPSPGPGLVYGDKVFETRAELRQYASSLPPAIVGPDCRPTPVLVGGPHARLVLLAGGGRQLAHHYLPPVITDDIQYL